MVCAYSLKHMAQAGAAAIVQMTGQHWAAGDKDGGNIDPCRSHQQARYILITVWNHDKRVKLMRNGHGFRGIGNQITGHQRVFHSDMAHRDSVADGDCRKHDRRAAGHGDALLHCVGNLIQIHVTRNDLVIGTYNSNQRPIQLLPGVSQGIEKRTVGCAVHTVCNICGKLHCKNLLLICKKEAAAPPPFSR